MEDCLLVQTFGMKYLQLVIAPIVAWAVFKLFLYPAIFSSLARIPNAHWTCGFSSAWFFWVKWTGKENTLVYRAHLTKGPVIRLTPNRVSVNCIEDGLKTIYQGGFPKPKFYFHGFAVYGKGNLFTIIDNTTHSVQKKIMSHSFSKSNVLGSQSARWAARDVLFDRALPKIHVAAMNKQAIEVIEFNYSYYLDMFVQWQFGRSLRSNLVEDEDERRMYLDGFFGPAGYTFWQYYFPKLSANLRKIGVYLIPKWVDVGFANVEDWNLEKCDKAQELLASGRTLSVEDYPVMFERVLRGMSKVDSKPKEYPNRLELASDMFSLNSGAFETSGNTTTYLFYEMCRNPQWQTHLRGEVLAMKNPPKYVPGKQLDPKDLTDPRELENLPVLHAIIMETLRLWPSVPGGQPRVAPESCTIGGYQNIPAGTILQSYASVLHRMPAVFPDPWAWKPERWLDASNDELAVMKRWFWGFGSGGRMCIGSHYAFFSMKYLVSSVYANFTTTIHDHGSMVPNDGYLAGPRGHRLEIKFHLLESM